ncbi:MAG: hypothetical protein KOO62_01515 [candidate division Zixibacteria bacterium]|nr:hypothetical protein [candidate division Zixibacteria bacterium]
MADYKTDVQNLYLSTSWQASPKVNINGMVRYTMSKAEYEQVIMPDVEDRLVNDLGDPELGHQDFTFDEMDQYSNLEYKLLGFSAGIQYRIASDVTITLDGDFADLKDDAGYVYGDETGQMFMIRTGVKMDF